MPNQNFPSIAQSFKSGDKLAGCYTLKERLPDQGFCTVWLAQDEELNKNIALHFVPDAVSGDVRARGELKQEAKRNRQLIHPRIVRVHDLVEDEKWAAISMDHVVGETLAAQREKKQGDVFSPVEMAPAISELCQTIEDAHRIDLFHRDLSPENLLGTANGVMIQKFGISRVILDALARAGQQIEGARDIAYISPQQLDGERPSRADDIYSLGATLYELLAGARPFPDADIVSHIRKTIPLPVSEKRAAAKITGDSVPKAWDDAIAACLAKLPEERPKSAAEAGARFASAKPGAASAAPAPAPAPATPAAEAVAAGAAAAAVVAEAAKPAPEPPKEKKEEPAPAPKEEAAPKPQKRPWGAGPGKAPLIAEATVISNTPVPKGEPKAETKTPETAAGGGVRKDGPGGPTTPSGFPLRAFVEVEDESKRPKGKSSGGLIAAVMVLLVILVVGYFVARNNGGNSSENTAAANATATPDETEGSPAPESSASPVETPAPAPVNVAANTTPAPDESPAAPAAAPLTVAETPAPIAGLATMTSDQINALIAEKTKALDAAKAALSDAEKDSTDKAAAQTQAAAAVQELQGTAKQKSDAETAAKKAADDTAAALKQQQDALQKAQADADAAQKIAADKAKAADQIRKAVQDAQTALQQQQSAAQQAETDATQLTKTIADRQKAADDAAKAALDAEKARQEQAQAVALAEADLKQVQGAFQQAQQSRVAEEARKAAEEAARVQKEREAETAKLAAQAAAAEKAAADAQKALDAAKKAVADAEKAQQAAEQQAAAAAKGVPMPAAVPVAVPGASPTAAPSAAPQTGAAASPAASPAVKVAANVAANVPSLTVHVPNPHMKVNQALINSLGMRFAPVGRVFFCIWLTRVEDFAAFAKATGFKSDAWRNPGFTQGPDHPVVNVTWNDANQFCLWLTEKEHREGILAANETYRLPTDLEWSNAVGLPPESGRTPEARDMDIPDVYPWGTQWPPPPGAGNYTGEETDSDVAIKGYNDGFAWTSPVGSFNANKFGLFDMGGNVWEWCEDWWNSEHKTRVLRGGSWYNGALKLSLLSSCRIHASANEGTDNYGFRVVISEEMGKKRHAGH